MNIENVPFVATDWNEIIAVKHPGLSGAAYWRTLEIGNIRVRMVEYTAGYESDHWCNRGHVLLVLEGELVTELENGTIVKLLQGMSYQVANGAEAHKSKTAKGAKLFIVD